MGRWGEVAACGRGNIKQEMAFDCWDAFKEGEGY